MNERIKDLVDQILPNEKEWHKGDSKDWGYFFSGDELEKFAELIVRECIGIVKQRWINPNEDVIAEEIKQHFGVEE
jgi:hypothetical protein